MSLLSHARIGCVRETILDTHEVSIQANNLQLVMAFLDDAEAEKSGNWRFHLHDFKTDVIEAERTRIQNLMIGGFLFNEKVKESSGVVVEAELNALDKKIKDLDIRMKKECTVQTFLQLIGLGDFAADLISKHAIRARNFSRKTWARLIQAAHKINMTTFAMRLDIVIGKKGS